jgi:hypothetical protein
MDEAAISTKETPGPFDGFERAKPGEPILTLQGGDPLGGPLVHVWVALERMRAGVGKPDPAIFERALKAAQGSLVPEAKAEALLLRATEAERIGWAMDEYRLGYVERPSEERASYNGTERTAEARAAAQESEARVKASGKLSNSVAESNDVAELARSLGMDELGAMIDAAVLVLKQAAEEILPARHILRRDSGRG